MYGSDKNCTLRNKESKKRKQIVSMNQIKNERTNL